MLVSYYTIYTNHFGRSGIEVTICKINNFSIVATICLKYYFTQLSCTKNNCASISFNELKIEKVNVITQGPTKILCVSVFKVGGCLASCFTFRPFLALHPWQSGCL